MIKFEQLVGKVETTESASVKQGGFEKHQLGAIRADNVGASALRAMALGLLEQEAKKPGADIYASSYCCSCSATNTWGCKNSGQASMGIVPKEVLAFAVAGA